MHRHFYAVGTRSRHRVWTSRLEDGFQCGDTLLLTTVSRESGSGSMRTKLRFGSTVLITLGLLGSQNT